MTSAKKKAAIRARQQLKRSIKAAKNIRTGQIRDFVFIRAGNRCELLLEWSGGQVLPKVSRCTKPAAHLDHVFGRGKEPQTVANCWALCVGHDEDKTNNRPSRAWFLQSFVIHANAHGYTTEAELAQQKLAKQDMLDGIARLNAGG